MAAGRGADAERTVSRERAPDLVLVGRGAQENLSLAYLAAACERSGASVEVLAPPTLADPHALARDALARSPRAIGLSMAFQAFAPNLMTMAAELRAGGFGGLLCAGGHFATLAAAQLLRDSPALDCIVMHEGEETLVELLRQGADDACPTRASLTAIAGLAYRDDAGGVVFTPPRRLAPLDALAWPRRSAAAPSVLGIGVAQLVSSRGCYGSCSFCSIQAWHRAASGPRFRARTMNDVADEMAWLRHERGVRVFNFQDDNFFVPGAEHNRRRFTELAARLLARGAHDVALSLKCRPNDVEPDTLALLEHIGLVRVYVGIETTSEQGLQTLGRAVTREDNARALELLRQRGVPTEFNLLIFDPDTTLESLVPNIELLEAFPEVPVSFCRTVVYTGTPLEQRLRAERRLRGSYLAWGYDLADPRADLVARICDVAFRQRNFGPQAIANLNRELGFELALLRRFHPAADLPELRRAAVSVATRLARSSARHLRDIVAFASQAVGQDAGRVRDFAIAEARAIHAEDFELFAELRALRAAVYERVAANEESRQ